MIAILLTLLLISTIQAIPFQCPLSDIGTDFGFITQNCNPDISQAFNMTAGGIYSAVGNLTYGVLYPFSLTYPPSPVTLLVNPTTQIVCFISPVLGTQCVNANAYYFALPASQEGYCFTNANYNFSRYVTSYQQAVNNEVCTVEVLGDCLGKTNIYTGLVQDGSACGNYVAVTLKSGFNSILSNSPQLRGYTLIQTIFNQATNSVIKIVQDLQFYTVTLNDPAAINAAIPASCASPLPYCSTFYPSGFDYTLQY